MIACIFCGGVLEIPLIIMLFGFIIGFFKKRHKKNCKCCQSKENKENDIPVLKTRSMTPEERVSINKFFMSHFKDKNE